MKSSENCRCVHHVVVKIIALLAWVSAVLFFWSSLGERAFFGFDAGYWAWTVVIFVLLSKTSTGCKCCCGDKHCQTCPVDTKKMM